MGKEQSGRARSLWSLMGSTANSEAGRSLQLPPRPSVVPSAPRGARGHPRAAWMSCPVPPGPAVGLGRRCRAEQPVAQVRKRRQGKSAAILGQEASPPRGLPPSHIRHGAIPASTVTGEDGASGLAASLRPPARPPGTPVSPVPLLLSLAPSAKKWRGQTDVSSGMFFLA